MRRSELKAWGEMQEYLPALSSAEADQLKRSLKQNAGVTPGRIRQIVLAAKKKKQADEHIEAIAKQQAPDFGGLYDVVVIDPPWPMKKIERDVRPNQQSFDYPTMAEGELRKFKLPMKANCHVWLWTTHRFLPLAFELLDEWALKYVCTFVWHKPGGFQPVGLPQYNCEFALYARRGSPNFVETKRFPACFEAGRRGHSVKPDEFYEMVRRVTSGRRIDMFSRHKLEGREIGGFEPWGNQA